MQQKFYYQRGMCVALGYNSLNPVLYESYGENMDYKKQKMYCNAIKSGHCKYHEQCDLLHNAPENISYNSFELYERKLT